MANIKVKTKNNLDIKSKPRVYFTCHPEDFEKHFIKICEDIFKTHDCAIYYTEDMTEVISDADKETDLNRNNLFVIPVTYKLLSTPNRAMDEDFPYAKEHHIPVLPVMMETEIDDFYSAPDKFGELQYLKPFGSDSTEVTYEEKLKKYLESVLISNELAERIRAAFDAYIFLSYRKKDRRYANELMRLIHSHPECRDIAIWFDEFLTPGESFKENINKILKSSKLFALLVTPNLLEEIDGKPNFVMGEEYPAAKKSGIDILPAEMESTNKQELFAKFKDLPEIVNPHMEDEFKSRLLESVSKLATESNNSPEHNFLIGLAYIDGIDVETNRQRGIELITMAAEANLPEAMKKLYDMYDEGIGVAIDYKKAVVWAKRIADYNIKRYGEEDTKTLTSLSNLAHSYNNSGEYQKALEINERVYRLRCKLLGEEHPRTLTTLSNLASTYGVLGNYQKALELKEKVYALRCKLLGEEHPDTLISLNNLAISYGNIGDFKKEIGLEEKVYALRCKVLGEEHPRTLTTLSNLASTYGDLGNFQKALELKEEVYGLRCKVLGEEHPDALISLNNLAFAYTEIGNHQKALELKEKAYALRCKVLGEEHPRTLTTLSNLASTYGDLGNYQKALELKEKVYALRCKVLGEEHPDTLISLNNLAFAYTEIGNHQKALELKEKAYVLRCKVLGEEHPRTLTTLSNLASTYGDLGNHKKALELKQKVYSSRCKILGEEHPDTLTSLNNLAFTYSDIGDSEICFYKNAIELGEKAYKLRCKVLGEDNSSTLTSLSNLALYYKVVEDYKNAFEYQNKLYLMRAKKLGENHTKTQKALKRLNEIKAKLEETP